MDAYDAVVIGGGAAGLSAALVQHALLVRRWSGDVVYFPHTHRLTAEERERLLGRPVEVVEGAVRRVAVDADERVRRRRVGLPDGTSREPAGGRVALQG